MQNELYIAEQVPRHFDDDVIPVCFLPVWSCHILTVFEVKLTCHVQLSSLIFWFLSIFELMLLCCKPLSTQNILVSKILGKVNCIWSKRAAGEAFFYPYFAVLEFSAFSEADNCFTSSGFIMITHWFARFINVVMIYDSILNQQFCLFFVCCPHTRFRDTSYQVFSYLHLQLDGHRGRWGRAAGPPAFSTIFYILHLVTVGGSTAREAVQIKMVRSEPDSLHFERRQMDFLQFIMMKPLGTKPMFVSPQNGLKLACIRQCMGKRNCRLRWAFVSTPPTNPHIHMDCLFPNQSLVPFNFSLQSKRIEITHHISTKLHANQCQLLIVVRKYNFRP